MTITLRNEIDLIHAVPHALGFAPADSVVLLAQRGTTVLFACRVDLPPAPQVPRLAAQLARSLRSHGAAQVAMAVFARDRGIGRPLASSLARWLDSNAIRSAPVVVTWGARWAHADCPPACCPPRGRPVPPRDCSEVVAAYVLQGSNPRSARADLELDTEPDASFHARVTLDGGAGPDTADRLWGAVGRVEEALAFDPGAGEVGRLARSLIDRTWRDALAGRLCPGLIPAAMLPPEVRRRAESCLPERPWVERANQVQRLALQGRLVLLARRTPPPLAAGPYTLAGLFAGWCGDGALANVTLDRALAADPDYVLARLTSRLVNAGILPNRFTSCSDETAAPPAITDSAQIG